MTALTVRTISGLQFFDLMSRSGDFRDYVTRVIALDAYSREQMNLEMRAGCARTRLMNLLKGFAELTNTPHSEGPLQVTLPLSQLEISGFLSLTPEHLSRLIRQLETDGNISRQKSVWNLNLRNACRSDR